MKLFKGELMTYIHFFFILSAIITAFSVGLNTNHDGYDVLFMLPLTYALVLSTIVRIKKKIEEYSIFYIVFIFVSYFRYVILPFYIVNNSYYGGRSMSEPDSSSYELAIFLMVYELIIVSLFINYLENKIKLNFFKADLILKTKLIQNVGIFLFIVVGVIFLVTNLNWLILVNFFIPKAIDFEVNSDILLPAYILILIKQILFVIIAYVLHLKYKKTGNMLLLVILFFVTAINIGIYIGTNRSDVLVPTIVSLLLISKLFGKRISIIISVVSIVSVFFLISLITETREFGSVSRGNSAQIDNTDFLQTYLGGPYNVAIAIETKEIYPESDDIEVLLFDFFRPILGVNFLIKDLDIKYSNIYFNKRIFKSDHRSQILPMIGQGYLFFNVLLSPIISLFFIYIAYALLNFSLKNQNALIFYFFTLSIARLGFFMGQNSMNMINDLSFNLLLFTLIYILNNKIRLA